MAWLKKIYDGYRQFTAYYGCRFAAAILMGSQNECKGWLPRAAAGRMGKSRDGREVPLRY